MKPQDILFLLVLLFIMSRKSMRLSAGVGIACLLIAIPLFAKYVFFTAEHLTWYAAAFFLLACIQGIVFELKDRDNGKK